MYWFMGGAGVCTGTGTVGVGSAGCLGVLSGLLVLGGLLVP